jgi:hypothetical protein
MGQVSKSDMSSLLSILSKTIKLDLYMFSEYWSVGVLEYWSIGKKIESET